MHWLKAAIAEIVGLFVDDGSFALAIVVWLGAFWGLLAHVKVAPGLLAIVFFLGLAVILSQSAVRSSKSTDN
jgi:hypothetical protein